MLQTRPSELQPPPPVYSSLHEEYTAATEAAGIVDRSYIGRLELSGDDALDLLNRLSTNKLDDLPQNQIIGTVLTTNKGRIIDLLFILRQNNRLLALTGPETRQRVAEWIDFYTFVEDVEVADVTADTAMISLIGPQAVSILPPLASIPLYGSASIAVEGIETLALRTDFAGINGFDLIVPSKQAPTLWDALSASGAVPIGGQALQTIRISNGIPSPGAELAEAYNPLEANLMRFISFNKGCYIGQEVVARLNAYDKVQKHLVKLSWDGHADIAPNSALYADGKQVGTITSVAPPMSERALGLGYVRKAHTQTGARLLADSSAEVVVEQITPMD